MGCHFLLQGLFPRDGTCLSRVSCIGRQTLHHSPCSRGHCPHPLILPEIHLLVCSFLALGSATLSAVSWFIFLLGLVCRLNDSVLAHPQRIFKTMDKIRFACCVYTLAYIWMRQPQVWDLLFLSLQPFGP